MRERESSATHLAKYDRAALATSAYSYAGVRPFSTAGPRVSRDISIIMRPVVECCDKHWGDRAIMFAAQSIKDAHRIFSNSTPSVLAIGPNGQIMVGPDVENY